MKTLQRANTARNSTPAIISGEEAKGLSLDKPSIRFEIDNTTNDVALKLGLTPRSGIDVFFSPGEKANTSDIAKAIVIGDGKIFEKTGDDTKFCQINNLSENMNVSTFIALLSRGAAQLTEGSVETSTAGQLRQAFQDAVTTSNGTVRKSLKVGMLKGQELSEATFLGPFEFPGNYTVGAERGLEYTVKAGGKVIVELYYENYVSVGSLLGMVLDRQSNQG